MKKLDEYSIGFKGLKEGEHLFEYALIDDFFALFEAPQIETGNIKAGAKLTKNEQMLVLEFDISGHVGSICDRCLEPLKLPVSYSGRLFVKFGDCYDEPTEEIVVLPHEAYAINVARYIYEFIVTSLPIRHLHPDDAEGVPGCDANMLEQLNHYLVNNIPEASHPQHAVADPRWSELNKLIDKTNRKRK